MELSSGPERRLFAHIRGLVEAGPPAVDRLLRPALAPGGSQDSFEPVAYRTVAALALLSNPVPTALPVVLDALVNGTPEDSPAVFRALALWEGPEVDGLLSCAWEDDRCERWPQWLEMFLHRAIAPPQRLVEYCLHADVAWIRALGLRGSLSLPALGDCGRAFADRHCEDDDQALRDAAYRTGLALGSHRVRAACLQAAARGDPSAQTLVGLVGGSHEHAALVGWIEREGPTPGSLWALGFCGRRDAADVSLALIDALDDEDRQRSLAFEAFCAITGLSPRDEEGVAVPRPWPSEQDLAIDPELLLPQPDPPGLREWWRQARPRIDGTCRLLGGEPVTPARMRDVLLHGSSRRRHALAEALELHSGGSLRLATRSFSRRQREGLTTLAVVPFNFERSLLGER
ncbi:conserved hypothetical protein [Nannocystis exedens]|uniref:TIGR02270 family protein n=2 Tax=Nannocystis exedens TaxID=54 RepID=A0A1I1YHG5_9BACT|nr:hypothetical protein NAEX_03405 [Nannocystis exedens]SFE18986.1 conserved hypothetical protein [Nannocystis exedens]